MILYMVNVTLKKDDEAEWLSWMRDIHIPDVLKTGYFIKADIYNIILPPKGGDLVSFSVQYMSESYEKFMSYSVKESKRLQQEHNEKFAGKISSERYVMETNND